MADDLSAYLANLSDKVAAELSGAVREQAERLSAAQRAELQSHEQAPQDSGALEASLVVVPGQDPFEFVVQAGGDLTTKEVRGGSGEPYDYAEGFEYGNSRQPARPFFWNTYDAMKDDMQEAINDAINEALR